MGGRLLQNLQQRIEGLRREHVHLVDDIHPLGHGGRGIGRLLQHGTHVVHAVVGGCVQLHHVQDGAVLNAHTRRTLVAGVAVLRMLTVHGPGQNFGTGGLTRSSGAGKQIGVGQPSPLHLTLEGLCNMSLPHHVVKAAGTPLSVQRLVQTPHPLKRKSLVYRIRPRTGL